MRLVRRGSAKNIWQSGRDTLDFENTDYYSVFDRGRSKQQIPGKGSAVSWCAVKSFCIAEKLGIPTHFISVVNGTTFRVRRYRVTGNNRTPTVRDENYVVPLEFVFRYYAAGSLLRRFKSGEEKPERYGLPAGKVPAPGTLLLKPARELWTKREKTDRLVTEEEACTIAGLTQKDLIEFWEMIDAVNIPINAAFAQAGFLRLDGKKECIIGAGRKKLLGDVFGTPDEDRPAIITGAGIEHWGKEYIREYHIASGYYDELKEYRRLDLPLPPIPALPPDVVEIAAARYQVFSQRYAAVKI